MRKSARLFSRLLTKKSIKPARPQALGAADAPPPPFKPKPRFHLARSEGEAGFWRFARPFLLQEAFPSYGKFEICLKTSFLSKNFIFYTHLYCLGFFRHYCTLPPSPPLPSLFGSFRHNCTDFFWGFGIAARRIGIIAPARLSNILKYLVVLPAGLQESEEF